MISQNVSLIIQDLFEAVLSGFFFTMYLIPESYKPHQLEDLDAKYH